MKTVFTWAVLLAAVCSLISLRPVAQDQTPSSQWEFVTIRWGGRENTCLIRPGARVEFIGTALRQVSKPDRVDERSFFMNVAMNGLSKDGYEPAGMTENEIIMKRRVYGGGR